MGDESAMAGYREKVKTLGAWMRCGLKITLVELFSLYAGRVQWWYVHRKWTGNVVVYVLQ